MFACVPFSSRDDLLLEAGFLAVLVAPLCCQSLPRRHDPMTFWLTRWLLFRLTFGSGVAKLAGHSAPWWNLSGKVDDISQLLIRRSCHAASKKMVVMLALLFTPNLSILH